LNFNERSNASEQVMLVMLVSKVQLFKVSWICTFHLSFARHPTIVTSFPGLSRLSVLQATESWAGPGNEATTIIQLH